MSRLPFLGGFKVTLKQMLEPRVTAQYPKTKKPKPPRLHGRHVLNRYEDGMEKCIGCELCAGVCPADCIYVRGADNPEDAPVSPGERYGFVYEINFLRCIHCDLCVEACPTEAITESKLFEFSFTSRADAIYTKAELLVDDDGMPKQLPWEDWREGEDQHTSGWMRATSPSGSAAYEGEVQWSGELGYGVRPPEGGQSGRRDDEGTGNISIRTVNRDKIPASAGGNVGKRIPGEASLMPLAHAAVLAATIPDAITFAIAAIICVSGAAGVVLLRNPVHAALSLVATLFGIAVLFVEEDAQFLAAVQVIVYAGAIVVLFLFVIMLLGVDRKEAIFQDKLKRQRAVGALLGVAVLAEVLLLAKSKWPTGAHSVSGSLSGQTGNVQDLGQSIFTTYLLPFEVTSALLVIAVIGAVALARRPPRQAGGGGAADGTPAAPAPEEDDLDPALEPDLTLPLDDDRDEAVVVVVAAGVTSATGGGAAGAAGDGGEGAP